MMHSLSSQTHLLLHPPTPGTTGDAWLCTQVATWLKPRHPMEAEKCWQDAIHILTALRLEFPSLTRNQNVLSDTMSNYTRFLVKNNRVSDAQQLNHDLAVKIPDDHKIHAYRSELLLSLGSSAEAFLALTAAIEEFPRQSAYYQRRATSQFHLSKYGTTLADLKQAVTLKYDDLSNLTRIEAQKFAGYMPLMTPVQLVHMLN